MVSVQVQRDNTRKNYYLGLVEERLLVVVVVPADGITSLANNKSGTVEIHGKGGLPSACSTSRLGVEE